MAHLDIKPAAVASVGSQVTAVASQPTPTTPAVTPPAQDPVSMAVAQTLSARVSAITGYTAAASAITDTRATMIKASSASYEHEEAANAASLGRGGPAPGGAPPTLPSGAIPSAASPDYPCTRDRRAPDQRQGDRTAHPLRPRARRPVRGRADHAPAR